MFVAAIIVSFYLRIPRKKVPPSLPETIPFISNGYAYVSNVGTFLDRLA
jgi:hypothetical protein